MGKFILIWIFCMEICLKTVTCADVASTFYPYGSDTSDLYGCLNDDQPYGPISVDNGFPFFGNTYDHIYISVNGAITGNPSNGFEPVRFPMQGSANASTLCDLAYLDDPYCWMHNYYATPGDWQTEFYEDPDRDNFPCLNGSKFEDNSGVADFPYVIRWGEPLAYEHEQCINFTETDNEFPDWMIALYWHDIDINYGDGQFLFRESTDASILALAKEDVERMKEVTEEFNPTWAFVLTWMNVTFYQGQTNGYPADCQDQGFSSDCVQNEYIENSMQLVVATDGTRSYGIYNYGAMNWGGGQVGFDAGDNEHYCSLSGSRTDQILNVQDRSNVGVRGRWVMSFTDSNFNDEMCEPHAALAACTCDEGYQGIMCGESVDDCEFQNCPEGGQCIDGHKNYTCTCGLDCQQESTCIFNVSQYICDCVHPSHIGTLCEDIDLCYEITCENSGTCMDGICSCTTGFAGDRCQSIDLCVGTECPEGSQCQNLLELESYFCDFCASDPCQNGSTCKSMDADYNCTCPGGLNTTNCEAGDNGSAQPAFDQQVRDLNDVPTLLAIIGGSLFGLLVLLAIIGLVIYLILRRRKKKIRQAKEKGVTPMTNNWTSTTSHGVKPKTHPPMIHSNTLTSLEAVPNSSPPAMFLMDT